MTKISFIVPVYNTGSYITKCLDTIINQTIKENIEIIIINDGSTDNSEELINEYISNNNEQNIIKYYSKENTGIAQTRNYGLEKATGEYIFFVDSDDYIQKDTIEKLKPYIDKNIDMIKFKLQRVDKIGNIIEKVESPNLDEMTGEEAFSKLYSEDILLDSPCLYLIKKELFTKNKFQFKRKYHEDFGLIPLLILASKTFVATPYYLYFYVQVENSITRNTDYKKTLEKMEDVLAHYDNMIEVVNKMELGKKARDDIKIFYTNAIILKLYELHHKEQKQYIKEIKKRKMYKNIKVRNLKQLFKKFILMINIKLYLKMR